MILQQILAKLTERATLPLAKSADNDKDKSDKDAGQRTPGGVATRDPEASATEPHQKNLGCGRLVAVVKVITEGGKRRLLQAGPPLRPFGTTLRPCLQQRHKRGEKRSYNNYREF